MKINAAEIYAMIFADRANNNFIFAISSTRSVHRVGMNEYYVVYYAYMDVRICGKGRPTFMNGYSGILRFSARHTKPYA